LTREDAVFDLKKLLSYSGGDDGPMPKTTRTMEVRRTAGPGRGP